MSKPDEKEPTNAIDSEEVSAVIEPKDDLVESKHTITLDGQVIPYTVTCGTIVLREESEKKGEGEGEAEGEKAKASVFFIAYPRPCPD